MATDKDAQTATRDAASKARGIADDTARAGETTTRRAADAARTIADEGAEAGTEMTRRSAEATRDIMGKATRMAGQTTEQFNKMMGMSAEAQGEVAQQARQNLDVMVQCSSVLMDGMQSIWREWLGLAQEAMARNADGISTMMRSRSIQDFYAAQSDLVKDDMELFLNRSVKISELSAQVANDAVRRLNARTEGAARQTFRA